jgi:hypothetical protein
VVFGVGSATVVRSRCICRDLCFAVGARCSLEGENAANARPIKKCVLKKCAKLDRLSRPFSRELKLSLTSFRLPYVTLYHPSSRPGHASAPHSPSVYICLVSTHVRNVDFCGFAFFVSFYFLMVTTMALRCRPFWSILTLLWSLPSVHTFQSNTVPTRIRNQCSHLHYQEEGTSTTAATETATEPPPLPQKKIQGKSTSLWEHNLARLKKFHQLHGHSLVTEHSGDARLFQWTKSIRRNYRHQALSLLSNNEESSSIAVSSNYNNSDSSNSKIISSNRPRLPEEKLQVLLDLDFPWDIQSSIWDGRYRDLQLYHTQHGHCRVAPTNDQFPRLGVWVRNQRREYKKLEKGEKSTLTSYRLQALRDLEFEWYRSHKDAWESRYQELSKYYEHHGHSNVPEDYVDNSKLGQWSMNQRTAYRRYAKGEPTALTDDRIQLLEEIDFRWNLRDHQWHTMKERLKEYYEQYGNVSISTGDKANTDLRGWKILQRYHYHRQKAGLPSPMTEKRIEAMETSIPEFSWKAFPGSGPSSADWSNLFGAMRDKGIQPGARPKQHWFEGINPQKIDVKNTYTDSELLSLWNNDDDDDEDDDMPFSLALGGSTEPFTRRS